MSEELPTTFFEEAICDGGTPVVDCEHCGTTHFDFNGEFMEEGELERLLQRQAKEPSKYKGHDGGVHFGQIAGRNYVYGCKCKIVQQMERFVWNHRFLIASYLKKRAAAELHDASRQHEEIAGIPEAGKS